MKDLSFYIVGGAVRDSLLGKEPHDFDIVVEGATPEKMKELEFISVGKSFPVFLHPKTKMEFALCRKEKKTGERHQDFEFVWDGVTINEDLQRRDFTMNAMACQCTVDLETGEVTPITLDKEKKIENCYIIDNFGGFQDTRNKVIRCVDPEHFIEDPLRVLRACRFAAQLGFGIERNTRNLLKQMVKDGMLDHLSRNRVFQEMEKAMQPGCDSSQFILEMKECGALKVLFPELQKLFENEENTKWHYTGNTGLHVMLALDVVRDCPADIKAATLYHDIGKPIVYPMTKEARKTDPTAYFGHDTPEILEYFSKCVSKHCFPYSWIRSIKLAIKYHMILWKLFDGMKCKYWVDLIGDITGGFQEHNEYLLDKLLPVCKGDDASDKSEYCVQHGQDEHRIEILSKVVHDTFDVCSKIKFKDVPNYQDTPLDIVLEKLRMMRVEAVKDLGYFDDLPSNPVRKYYTKF